MLSSRSDIQICGEAANGEEAIAVALQTQPDSIILDITIPVLGGFGAAKEIKRLMPNVPILFFSMHETSQMIQEAKRFGVQGFVAKERMGKVLLLALDALFRNEDYFPTGD